MGELGFFGVRTNKNVLKILLTGHRLISTDYYYLFIYREDIHIYLRTFTSPIVFIRYFTNLFLFFYKYLLVYVSISNKLFYIQLNFLFIKYSVFPKQHSLRTVTNVRQSLDYSHSLSWGINVMES